MILTLASVTRQRVVKISLRASVNLEYSSVDLYSLKNALREAFERRREDLGRA